MGFGDPGAGVIDSEDVHANELALAGLREALEKGEPNNEVLDNRYLRQEEITEAEMRWTLRVLSCVAPHRTSCVLMVAWHAWQFSHRPILPQCNSCAPQSPLNGPRASIAWYRNLNCAGKTVLSGGGSAIDAVEACVVSLEDCPSFNAGLDMEKKGPRL